MATNKFNNSLDIKRYINHIKANNEEIFKKLYPHRQNLFNILDEEGKTLPVEYEDCKQRLSEYFILNKLIREKKIIYIFHTLLMILLKRLIKKTKAIMEL